MSQMEIIVILMFNNVHVHNEDMTFLSNPL